VSVYRASLFAIGAGLHKAPAMLMRFRGDVVVRHDTILMSMTVPNEKGSFNFAYVPFQDDFAAFDPLCRDRIAAAARGSDFAANTGQRDDLSYLSCLPWLDYTSLNNALPGADDCIPRVSWGKIVQDHDGRWRMAMTVEVHHALVDGADVGEYFAAVQETLDTL
jgi:chloramphenicol O-acetyltransferase type A